MTGPERGAKPVGPAESRPVEPRWAGSARSAVSLVVGVSGATAASVRIPGFWSYPGPVRTTIVILLALGVAAAVRCARGRANSRLGALAGLLTGAFLVVVIPSGPPLPHRLEIVATGRKNPASQGSEVWVPAIRDTDGGAIPSSELQLGAGWEVRDGVPVSLRHQPAVLKWRGGAEGDVTIVLGAHPWSGIAAVRLDGFTREVDLYADVPGQEVLSGRVLSGGRVPAGRRWLAVGLHAADAVSLGFLVWVAGAWLARRPATRSSAPTGESAWAWLGYGLPSIVVSTVFLLTFWPGLMSADSLDQWRQILTREFNDWHPAFHTLTNWLITRAWESPAAVAGVQIVVLGALVGLGIVRMRRLGAGASVAATVSLLAALSPANATMAITLWKDVAYSLALFGLTLLVLDVVSSDGAWLERRTHWVLLGSVAALVALYRHSGALPAVGSLGLLALSFPARWRPLARALMLAVTIWLGVHGPLHHLLGVTGSRWLSLAPLIYDVAAHVDAGTPLEPEEREYLESIRQLDDHWGYSCDSIDPTVWDPRLHPHVIEAQPRRFVRQWWTLARRNPGATVDHLICSSALVWRITAPPARGFYAANVSVDGDSSVRTILDNALDVRSWSLLPSAQPVLAALVTASQVPAVSWFLWRPALYLYLLLGGVVIASLRRGSPRYLLVALPVALDSLGMLFLTLAQQLRYQYGTYLVGLVVGLLLYAVRADGREPCTSRRFLV